MKCSYLLFRLSGIGIAKSNGYETVAQLFWSGQRLHLELVHSPQRHSIGILRLGLDSWPLNEGFERKALNHILIITYHFVVSLIISS